MLNDPIEVGTCKLFLGDNIDILKEIEDSSIDSCVTDPPYGISFMNKKWDYNIPPIETWKEVLRVLKPGAHALVACGTKTQHRMTVNLEDAGFEIRDIIAWVYGSGFPKSQDIGKAVDKLQGNKRDITGIKQHAKKDFKDNLYAQDPANRNNKKVFGYGEEILTKGNSEFEGYGTALKPAMELWTLCRKPLSEKTIAKNVLKYRTGGINIDDCRIGNEERTYNIRGGENINKLSRPKGNDCETAKGCPTFGVGAKHVYTIGTSTVIGRFPANFIHDGSEEILELFPDTKSGVSNGNAIIGEEGKNIPKRRGKLTPRNDHGSAARFFYCAKASSSERGENNSHPTVKPLKLMIYLAKLITPKNGIVIDPFMGSGTTCGACIENEFGFIGIENDRKSFQISYDRILKWHNEKKGRKHGANG